MISRGAVSRSLSFVLAAAVICLLPTTAWSQGGEWTIYNTSNSGLPYRGITAMTFDEQGNAWIGTGRWWAFEGGGLAKFDGENWTVYNTSNSGLSNNDTVGLSVGPDGSIWCGSEDGLSRFDGQSWTVYKTSNSGLRSNQAGAPVFDSEGNAWIAAGCVAKFDGQNWTVYYTGNSGLPNNFVTGLGIDAYGDIWAGTFGNGVVKFDGQSWTLYNTGNSNLPHNDVSFLDTDDVGNVWVGTYGGGIAKFDGQKWTPYGSSNSGLPNNWIWNITVDSEGSVWAGTKAGLAKFDGTRWTVFNTANSALPDNNVYYAAFEAHGSVWIGTQDGGLAVYRPLPPLDLNEDETVDFTDFSMLAPFWHQHGTPFCDQIVDCKYLTAMAEYWLEEVLPASLVAYWKLDESEGTGAKDSAGKHEGLLVNGAQWQPEDGAVDGALAFDGVNDYVYLPFVLNPSAGSFSVFMWVRGGGPGQVMISQIDTTGAWKAWLCCDPVSGTLATELQNPGRGGLPLGSDAAFTDGQWHRIGFVWDGYYRRLYIDGEEVAADAEPQGDLDTLRSFTFVGVGSAFKQTTYFSGLIDDIRIYNKAIEP